MTPLQHIENIRKSKSERMRRLAKHDSKDFGNFTGMKTSFVDRSHTEEINTYMGAMK